MANLGSIVKIINFHSLLRVDKAKREAQRFREMEIELHKIISLIMNNKNFNLDRVINRGNPKGEVLNIYIGNDMGFCGSFNSVINGLIKKDLTSKKIVIGKKMNSNIANTILYVTKEELYQNINKLEEIIKPMLQRNELKSINVIFYRYNKVNDISLETKLIYPAEINENVGEINTDTDFITETDINDIIISLISTAIIYQIKTLEMSSWASENVMREITTRESLKKIEEIEEEKLQEERKQKKQEMFKKQIENSRKATKQR